MTEVVVTGRGVVTSLGEGAEAFLAALFERRSGIEDGLGPCADFDVERYLTPREARRIDRFAQLAIAAADQAWTEAGLEDAADGRVGVVVGTASAGSTRSSARSATSSRAARARSRRTSCR